MEDGYSETAIAQLDELQAHAPERLWNAIVDALGLIFDEPETARQKGGALRGDGGISAWKYDVRVDDDEVAILWRFLDDSNAFVAWVAPWPPE